MAFGIACLTPNKICLWHLVNIPLGPGWLGSHSGFVDGKFLFVVLCKFLLACAPCTCLLAVFNTIFLSVPSSEVSSITSRATLQVLTTFSSFQKHCRRILWTYLTLFLPLWMIPQCKEQINICHFFPFAFPFYKTTLIARWYDIAMSPVLAIRAHLPIDTLGTNDCNIQLMVSELVGHHPRCLSSASKYIPKVFSVG